MAAHHGIRQGDLRVNAAQPAKLRTSPRCTTRPNRQNPDPESRSRWIRVGGNVRLYSYSIYLAHYVIIRILHKHGWFEGNPALFIAAAAVISIAYAAFVWHVIEAVPRRLRHRFA